MVYVVNLERSVVNVVEGVLCKLQSTISVLVQTTDDCGFYRNLILNPLQ